MDIRLRTTESIRVIGDSKQDNFIDIIGINDGAMCQELYPRFVNIEIRIKDNRIRLYTFPTEYSRLDCDFGWWDDAEILFTSSSIERDLNKIG